MYIYARHHRYSHSNTKNKKKHNQLLNFLLRTELGHVRDDTNSQSVSTSRHGACSLPGVLLWLVGEDGVQV